MLSCLIPSRLDTIIYIHNTTNKNDTKTTITINVKLIFKLGATREQQCENQEQKTLTQYSCSNTMQNPTRQATG